MPSSEFLQTGKIEASKREKMPEVEAGDIIAAGGNSEAKALLEIAMQHGTYTRMDMHRLMLNIQLPNKGWAMNKILPFQWCEDSLEPIGLVALRKFDSKSGLTVGYEKTEKGFVQADALFGHLLEFSEAEEQGSLYQYFGSTNSSSGRQKAIDEIVETKGVIKIKNRAPLTRCRIFYELLTVDRSITQNDLVRSLHESSPEAYSSDYLQIETHLRHLGKVGLIQHEWMDANTPVSFYHLADDKSKAEPDLSIGNIPSTITQVYELFQRFPQEQWSYAKIQEFMRGNYGKDLTLSTISNIFTRLRNAGIIQRGEFGNERRTSVSLTFEQRERLLGLVTIVDRFIDQDPDFLEEGREKAREIISDPARVAALMRKAQKNSPQANNTSSFDTASRVEIIICDHPGCTTKDIQGELDRRFGQKLSLNSVFQISKRLENLEITKCGVQNHYSLRGRQEREENMVFRREE